MKTCLLEEIAGHVVLVCVSLRGGGTERIVCRLADFFVKRWKVTIVTLVFSEPFYAVDDAVAICMPPESWRNKAKALRSLLQLNHTFRSIRDAKPDACLIFGEDIAAPVAMVARLAGVTKVAVFPRGTPSRSTEGAKGVINAIVYRAVDQVVVQTEQGRQALKQKFPTASLRVIPNPIEIPDTCRSLSERENWVLCVGSLGRKKNQEALIRVFSILENARNWCLVFVGDGPDRARLEALGRASAAADRIRFVGEQAYVHVWMNQARIFAFPSLSEGFPNALAEALAAGCACISYDCPAGPADLIEHEQNGLLVANDDEAAFKFHLQRLVDDSELQAALSVRARKSMQRFSADHVLEQFEHLIQAMVSASGNPRAPSCD